MSTAELEAITRAAGDVCCLVAIANDLVSQAEAGDTGRVHELGAVLRAAASQAKALRGRADVQWMAARAASCAEGNSAADVIAVRSA